MYKRLRIIVILLIMIGTVSAQKKLSTIEVDKKSYELFKQKKWKELIHLSKEARNQGINFFYLEARTGIAYYKQKKYRIAAEYLLRVWEKDKSFEWLQEYLYYSLLLGGRYAEASKVAVDFSSRFQEKIGYENPKVTRFAFEGGYGYNADFDKLKNSHIGDEIELGEEEYGEALIFNHYHFESIDLSHRISPDFSVNHNLTLIGMNREQQVNDVSTNSLTSNTLQFQYYINPHFLLGEKIHFSPSLNLIMGSLTYLSGSSDYSSARSYYETEYSYSDHILSASVWSHYGNFSPGAELNLSDIDDMTFMQLSTWFTYYPLSNVHLYFTPRVYFKSGAGQDFGINTLGISGGLKLGRLHIHGQYLKGDMENFIEPGGYVVSNFPGKSEYKYTGSLYFRLAKQTYLVGRYINQNVIEKYQTYTYDDTEIESIKYDYIKQTLTLGLSWYF